jgi:hypothetical protein
LLRSRVKTLEWIIRSQAPKSDMVRIWRRFRD